MVRSLIFETVGCWARFGGKNMNQNGMKNFIFFLVLFYVSVLQAPFFFPLRFWLL